MKKLKWMTLAGLLASIYFICLTFPAAVGAVDVSALSKTLDDAYVVYYTGDGDGGLAHVTYWDMSTDSEEYVKLPPKEQLKVVKIQANSLHSSLFHPTQVISGYEVTGRLTNGKRVQNLTLRLPDDWNGKLVVLGTPGTLNEYANEAVFVPWLLEAGYALVCGDKGLLEGMNSLFSGEHLTQYWGKMMLDLARWARKNIKRATNEKVTRIYAAGLSNGGYQVRRALELDDEEDVELFDGGLDWSGTYWPSKEVLDVNDDDHVSIEEFANSDSLIPTIDRAMLAMKWAYAVDTNTTMEQWDMSPHYPSAQNAMIDAGFTPQSSAYWGYYNTILDPLKNIYQIYKGVGYYNLVSYAYRAELRGDEIAAANAYSCYYDPANPDTLPPIYNFVADPNTAGWTQKAVRYALKNANTGEFEVPLISLHGDMDALVGTESQAYAYRDAVIDEGEPDLHRLYIIENAGHVDAQADGIADFNFDGNPYNDYMADQLTPMQGYVERAFEYLVDWVENGVVAPQSKIIPTDPVYDAVDPRALSW